jgi:hypothetical protein
MGIALFVTFEREIPGVNGWDMGGKSLARNLDPLDEAAKHLGLTPLLEFHSASPQDLAGFLGEDEEDPFDFLEADASFLETVREQHGQDAADEFRALGQEFRQVGDDLAALREQGLPPEQWYPPADGLRTVRGLAEHVRSNPDEFERADDLLADLADVERYLLAAEGGGVRFHLSFDI